MKIGFGGGFIGGCGAQQLYTFGFFQIVEVTGDAVTEDETGEQKEDQQQPGEGKQGDTGDFERLFHGLRRMVAAKIAIFPAPANERDKPLRGLSR